MSNTQLPNGWLDVSFTEILDIQGGTQPPKSDFIDTPQKNYIRLLQIRDFGSKPVLTYIPYSTKIKTCDNSDILIARYGASLGRICTGMSGAYNVALAKVLIPLMIEKKYTRYYLRSDFFQNPLALLSRSAQNGFNKEDLKEFKFLLPPIAEQKEIATLLDNLLAQVDTLKTRLDAIPNILKRFRQSVLAAAVSGKLTEKNTEYGEVSFGELITEMRNGLSPQPNDDKRGYPILRISAVRSLDVDKSDHRFLECDEKTLSIYVLKNNDLLFTRYNGSLDFVGVCGLYQGNSNDKFLYPDKLIRVRTKQNRLIPQYAEIFFSSPQIRKVVTDFVKSTSGQKGISGKDLKSVLINLPPIEEQTEIVRRVEELFAFADQIEQRVKVAQQRVNHLTQAILAKAFRGELTAEWREQNPDLISGENSAAALLARIQAEQKLKQGLAKPARRQPKSLELDTTDFKFDRQEANQR